MVLTFKNFIISLLLIVAASLSCWSIFLSIHSEKKVTQNFSNQPDAIMEGIIATVMNKDGKPTLKVETPKMVHYVENDRTELTKPHLTIFRNSPEPWYVEALHGKTVQGINEITFWDNVVIHHLADHDNPITTMKTQALTIFPNQQLAETKEAISVIQPDTRIDAIGMLANWNEGTVKLLSQAREEYVPSS